MFYFENIQIQNSTDFSPLSDQERTVGSSSETQLMGLAWLSVPGVHWLQQADGYVAGGSPCKP